MSAQGWIVCLIALGAAAFLYRRLRPKASGSSCDGCCGGSCHSKK